MNRRADPGGQLRGGLKVTLRGFSRSIIVDSSGATTIRAKRVDDVVGTFDLLLESSILFAVVSKRARNTPRRA